MESGKLTPRELRRYSNQIAIPEIGMEGQERLKKAKVLVVGAGGLGCPILLYLSSAGVGKIGIVEFDTVDEPDLQCQLLYGTLDVGKLKVIIAKNCLEHLNTLIDIEVFNLRLDISNAIRIVKQFDLVVDATNDIKVRYIINDSCVMLNKPMVYGTIRGFEGGVSVFNFNNGPTYRCFNTDNEKEFDNKLVSSDKGQVGAQYGITGTFMANEVIKILTGTGSVLSGKILLFNSSDYSFCLKEIKNIAENHNIHELREE